MIIKFEAPFDGVEWSQSDKQQVTQAIVVGHYHHGRSATCTDCIVLDLMSGKRASGLHDWDTNVWVLHIGHGIGSVAGLGS